MLKHATASVFLFARQDDDWRIGLIHHTRLHRWMLPGGHVEPHENPAETAVRETREETGWTTQLVTTHSNGLTAAALGVPMPVWITEPCVPAEPRYPHPHIHVDHLYVAVAIGNQPDTPAELRFGWFSQDNLASLHMFDSSRRRAVLLFDHIDDLVTNHTTTGATTIATLGAPT
ncbi:NUDIX domain-containing protein [Virgisporangium aurantiacum]|uniref:Nudix hydrolase domain-containing protein n=1 Tax=Virgisporangium aurantiacum TaxID=175570 RepID=A0A8J4E7V0_9ACTN|nr:NUDIX domain-containing protein [Virgisporangium aurantiacum]GIJ62142.1 hypothetical protein Vau01_096580 [Virgisporangium aurantiacum]